MSIEENKAVVRRLWDEYYVNRNDAVLKEVVSRDYEINVAWAGWTPWAIRGPDAIRAFMRLWWRAFPDLSFTIDEMIGEGDKVVAVVTCRGTHLGEWTRGPYGPIQATGRQLILQDMVVSKLVDGRVVAEWESANFGSLWRQLGAIPPPN